MNSFPDLKAPYDIGQVVMGVALKGIANRERRILGRASGRRSQMGANIATSVTDHLGVVFKPQKKTFFELATERLPDGRSRTRS